MTLHPMSMPHQAAPRGESAARRPRAGRAFAAAALAAALNASAQTPPPDAAALKELIDAVGLDVMSEATLQACTDMGVPAAAQMRDAWVAWRERHQLAPLRVVVMDVMRRRGSSAPSWDTLTDPLRQRVLADPRPDATCAALAGDWQGAAMDATALYPRARATALALVQAKAASRPELPAVMVGPARGQVLLPSQLPALAAGAGGGWRSLSADVARREKGMVYVKGLVERWSRKPDRFRLIQAQGDRRTAQHIYLKFDAEPWVGREVVLRGVLTSLRDYAADLAEAELVNDATALTPSPLPQTPLARKEVLLQRVMTAPGRGLSDKDLAAVVLHGEGNYNNGTSWDEDVRFLLRDGSYYHRTDMPPDQLDVAASRRLEPQRWGRWRSTAKGYEMQAQDDDGRPAGDWKPVKHAAVRPWPAGAKLEGSFSRSRFDGSLVLGGRSSTRGIRFTRDGRFERSYHALSSSGTLAATLNDTVIAGSAHGDGKGSSSTGGGSVGTATGTVVAGSSSRKDDGASRRGRYQIDGYAITLLYDDGRQERLLSFPSREGNRSVYVGDGSFDLDK